MPWYFRKSVGFGFGRINFSKTGVSYSFGRKGARINMGPRGTFVTFGSNGIYYRTKIAGPHQPTEEALQPSNNQITSVPHTITSAFIDQLTDSDSKEFINELTAKSKKISYFKWLGVLPAILFVIFFLYYFSEISKTKKKAEYYITVPGTSEVNIRMKPDKNSSIIDKAIPGNRYDFVDSTATGWNKIKFSDTIGFVSSKFSKVDSVLVDGRSYNRFETDSKNALSVFIICTIFFGWLLWVLHKQDKKRLMVEIHYDMDEKIMPVYEKFIYHFTEVMQARKVWQYLHAKANYDLKHHAGAGQLINRINVRAISSDKKPSRFFVTNVNVPNLRLRNTDLYFFPERLLIKRGNDFAAVFYKHLNIESIQGRFIEDGPTPSDARVVDYTWKFVNKNGGPDRRFNNNRQLPVCMYSDYTISSETGVYEIISTSKIGAFDNFAKFIKAIGDFQTKL